MNILDKLRNYDDHLSCVKWLFKCFTCDKKLSFLDKALKEVGDFICKYQANYFCFHSKVYKKHKKLGAVVD